MSQKTWGYTKQNGPKTWHKSFPVAESGLRQSPIDVDTSKVAIDSSLEPISVFYRPGNIKFVENTGTTLKVHVDGQGSELTGGPLNDSYELWQFHAHWGKQDYKGSEHRVDGESFAGELHFVHWNRKYGSSKEAVKKADGLAVLGVLVQAGDKSHPEFDKILSLLPDLRRKGSKASMMDNLDPADLLPEDKEFWTYEGSLTTPPLTEIVIWILFKKPITLSSDQLQELRKLLICEKEVESDDDDDSKCLVKNYRPPMPIGDRIVRTNDA